MVVADAEDGGGDDSDDGGDRGMEGAGLAKAEERVPDAVTSIHLCTLGNDGVGT